MSCEKIKKRWVNMELEHTKSRKRAKEIVKDHIKEYGSKYYPSMIKLTDRLKKIREKKKKMKRKRKSY